MVGNINLPNNLLMGRPKIPDEQKIAEGAFVKAAFERAQAEDPDITQDSIGAEVGVTQGNVGQWFSGKTPIPDKTLVYLGGRLRFDPYELRPSLQAYVFAGLAPHGREKALSKLVKFMIEADDLEFHRLKNVLYAFLGERDSRG